MAEADKAIRAFIRKIKQLDNDIATLKNRLYILEQKFQGMALLEKRVDDLEALLFDFINLNRSSTSSRAECSSGDSSGSNTEKSSPDSRKGTADFQRLEKAAGNEGLADSDATDDSSCHGFVSDSFQSSRVPDEDIKQEMKMLGVTEKSSKRGLEKAAGNEGLADSDATDDSSCHGFVSDSFQSSRVTDEDIKHEMKMLGVTEKSSKRGLQKQHEGDDLDASYSVKTPQICPRYTKHHFTPLSYEEWRKQMQELQEYGDAGGNEDLGSES